MSKSTAIVGAVALLIALKLMAYVLLTDMPLESAMCQWDCGAYKEIVDIGYDAQMHFVVGCCWQANWAFFPLFPLLILSLKSFIDASTGVLGIIVSSAFFWAFALLGVKYRVVTRHETSVWPWLIVLLCGPNSFYFQAGYTESLFAMLVMLIFLGLVHHRPWVAAIATGFLTATRPTGVLMAILLGFRQLWAVRLAKSWGEGLSSLAPLAVAPLGIIGFMTFLYFHIGDALAFLHIQSGWGRTGGNPLRVLSAPFISWKTGHLERSAVYFAAWAILGLMAAAWLASRRFFAEAWLCGAVIILALSSGSLQSMPRFVATNPAFLLAAADFWVLIQSRYLRAIIALTLVGLQAVLVLEWSKRVFYLI